jgi:hypothetical protein
MTTKLNWIVNQGEDTAYIILCYDDVGPIDLTTATRCELMVLESMDGPRIVDLTLAHGLAISPSDSHKLNVTLSAADTDNVVFKGPWLHAVYNCEVDVNGRTVQVQDGVITFRRDVVWP